MNFIIIPIDDDDVAPAVGTLASHVWIISISATAMSALIRILKVRTKRQMGPFDKSNPDFLGRTIISGT